MIVARVALAAVCLAGALLGAPASAQPATDPRTVRFGDLAPFAAVTTGGGFRWRTVSFYVASVRGAGDQIIWVARMASGDGLVQAPVVWADSRSCGALPPLLDALEAVRMPGIDVPGRGQAPPEMLLLDGGGTRLWGMAMLPVGGATVELSSSHSPETDAWVGRMFADLAPCWSPTAPATSP